MLLRERIVMNKRGFTLAEVLVALMVIVVVAVLLVKVVQNVQDFQFKQA